MKVRRKGKIEESKQYIFLLVFLCVLILLIAFLWFQGVLRKNINQTNYEIMQETARQQLLGFETKIQGQLNQLQLYARSFAKVDMNDYNAVKELINVTEGAGSFQTISIANTTGKLVNNNNTSAGNIMKEQYFKAAIAGNAAVGIGDLADDGALALYFAVPIYQEETVIGVLVGSVKTSTVNEAVMRDSFRGLGATFIIDREGNILLQSDNGADFIGGEMNYLSYLTDAKADGVRDLADQIEENLADSSTEVYRCKIGEEEYIMIRNPLAINDWSLILQVNAVFVNSQSTQILSYVFVLLLLVLISMLVIVAALFRLQSRSDRLKNKAECDLLTNLLNKKTFEGRVENMIANHSADEAGALWIIDLDNFKGINDKLGHLVGDRVLSLVAEKMRETFRQQDYLGRIGGDEFAVYLTFHNQGEQRTLIESRAEQFSSMIGKIAKEMQLDVIVSCSIGIALDPEHGTSYEELYRSADKALYQSKEAGKNQYRILS